MSAEVVSPVESVTPIVAVPVFPFGRTSALIVVEGRS